MKWKSLLMPNGIQVSNPDDIPNYARIVVEPLERGWGHTLGNGLRRVLLSSIQGAAVTSIKLEGALHEYAMIPGVSEDVTDIILNVKKLHLKLVTDGPTKLTLNLKGKGVVTAGDIEMSADVEILNPELVIATINEDADSVLTMHVNDGRGYVSSVNNKRDDAEVGEIPIDAIYSPVLKVNYIVEDTRQGQRVDLDKLILDIWTDGALTPEEAVSYASKIFYDHLEQMINVNAQFEVIKETRGSEKEEKLRLLLSKRIDELELSVRSNNCLRAANILTLGELVRNQESDMLKYKNFGRKSLIELNQVLAHENISFGMDVDKIMGNE